MIRIYGIKNCDTMKKAFSWLAENGVEYSFHDYKIAGMPEAELRRWVKELGWRSLINTQGTTWRKLDPADRESLTQGKALALMREHSSLVKRPLCDTGQQLIVGFDPALYASFVKPAALAR